MRGLSPAGYGDRLTWDFWEGDFWDGTQWGGRNCSGGGAGFFFLALLTRLGVTKISGRSYCCGGFLERFNAVAIGAGILTLGEW
jgi:hypothetical protein